MGEDKIEGVVSEIIFPLDQDCHAVSLAISQLLSEGWKFLELTPGKLHLTRTWEFTIPPGLVEKQESPQ